MSTTVPAPRRPEPLPVLVDVEATGPDDYEVLLDLTPIRDVLRRALIDARTTGDRAVVLRLTPGQALAYGLQLDAVTPPPECSVGGCPNYADHCPTPGHDSADQLLEAWSDER